MYACMYHISSHILHINMNIGNNSTENTLVYYTSTVTTFTGQSCVILHCAIIGEKPGEWPGGGSCVYTCVANIVADFQRIFSACGGLHYSSS